MLMWKPFAGEGTVNTGSRSRSTPDMSEEDKGWVEVEVPCAGGSGQCGQLSMNTTGENGRG